MATKRKVSSAVKAYRQNIKRRDHNRQLRSRLRTGAEGDSSGDRDERPDGGERRADERVLPRGQDGEQGHHPQERRRPLQVTPRQARFHEAFGGLKPPELPAQLDNQPLQQDLGVAARRLHGDVRPEAARRRRRARAAPETVRAEAGFGRHTQAARGSGTARPHGRAPPSARGAPRRRRRARSPAPAPSRRRGTPARRRPPRHGRA